MKEATGELNLAVVVAISIGILAAFFFTYLWPLISNNFERTTQCDKAVCNCNADPTKGEVGIVEIEGVNYCTCWVDGNETNQFNCVFKG